MWLGSLRLHLSQVDFARVVSDAYCTEKVIGEP
jgi:hypothetical protein